METLKTIMVAILSCAATTLVGLLINHLWKKHTAEAEKLKQLQAENELRKQKDQVAIIMANSFAPMAGKLEIIDKKLTTIGAGTLASLRNDLLNCYYACAEKGYKTQEDATNFEELYVAYHKLGGNSFMDSEIVPAFRALPLKHIEYNK